MRSWNALIASGRLKISDIIALNTQDLYEIRNLGKKSVAEIINVIDQLNQMFPKYDTSQNLQSQTIVFPRRSKKMKSLTERMLSIGVFPESETLELSELEASLLQIVFNSMSTIGIELSNSAYYSPETIAPLFLMLGEYIRYYEKEKQLREEFNLIPEARRNKRIQHYISATGNKLYDAKLNSLNTVEEVKSVFFEVCKDKEKFDILLNFLRFLRTDYVESVSSLMQKVFDDASDPRSQHIVRQRELGVTLEAIGREEGITRERIRQIEARVMKKLSQYITSIGFDVVAIVYAERDGDPYLTYDEVAEYYKDAEIVITFMRLITDSDLYTSNIFKYNKYSKAFLRSDAENDLDKVMRIVDNFPCMVLQDQLDALFGGSNQRESISVEMLKDEFSRRYKLMGKVYHTGQFTLTEIYKFIMERHYLGGIKLYDAQEISKFRRHIHDTFGDVALPENNRAIDTRVADVSILCDRGMYIHPSYVHIDQTLISEIFDYIFESDKTAISFNELYEVFKEKLLLNSNISNRYFLQGILKYDNKANLYFAKDYLSKEQGVNIDNEIEEFISRHDITCKSEVFAAFPGLTEIMLSVRAATLENVLVLDNGRYMHADRLNIRPDDYSIKTELDIYVRSLPVSSRKILDALSLTHPDFLTRNGIDGHSKLFAVIRYMFPEDYVYSRPFIAPIGTEDVSNFSVVKQYLSNYDKIFVTDVIEICNANHIKYGPSLRKLIRGINDEFLRTDADLLSRYDVSVLNDNVLSDIGNALNRMLDDNPIA
jgi:hypothetical protein